MRQEYCDPHQSVTAVMQLREYHAPVAFTAYHGIGLFHLIHHVDLTNRRSGV